MNQVCENLAAATPQCLRNAIKNIDLLMLRSPQGAGRRIRPLQLQSAGKLKQGMDNTTTSMQGITKRANNRGMWSSWKSQ